MQTRLAKVGEDLALGTRPLVPWNELGIDGETEAEVDADETESTSGRARTGIEIACQHRLKG